MFQGSGLAYSEVSGLVIDVVEQVEVGSYDGHPLIPTGFVRTLMLILILGLYNAGVDMEMPFCSKNRDAISQAVGPKQYDDRVPMCFKRNLGSFSSQLIRTPEYISDIRKHPQNDMVHTLGSVDMYHFEQVYHHLWKGSLYSASNWRWSLNPWFLSKLQGRALVMGERMVGSSNECLHVLVWSFFSSIIHPKYSLQLTNLIIRILYPKMWYNYNDSFLCSIPRDLTFKWFLHFFSCCWDSQRILQAQTCQGEGAEDWSCDVLQTDHWQSPPEFGIEPRSSFHGFCFLLSTQITQINPR